MNKCKYTKFNGIISNQNLPVLNGVKVWFDSTTVASNPYIQLDNTGGGKMTVIEGTVFDSNNNPVSTIEGKNVWCKTSGTGSVLFTNKYNLTILAGNGSWVESLKEILPYADSLVKCRIKSSDGIFDLGWFSGKNFIREIHTLDAPITRGDLSSLQSLQELVTLNLGATSTFTGDVECLANLIKLATLAINNSLFTGDLANLAAGQVSAGRTSGTLNVDCWHGTGSNQITLNGNPLQANQYAISFGSSYVGGYNIIIR